MNVEIYNKVNNRIKLQKVNKFLSNCELDSKLSKECTWEKLEKVFSINTTDIIAEGTSKLRSDLSKSSTLKNKLDAHLKPSSDMLKKKIRSGSVTSLSKF